MTTLHTEVRRVVVRVVVVDHTSLVQRLLYVVVCALRVEVCRPREVDQC